MPTIHVNLKKFQLLIQKVEKAVLCTHAQYTYRQWLFWCGSPLPFKYVVQCPGLETVMERWQDISYVPRMLS